MSFFKHDIGSDSASGGAQFQRCILSTVSSNELFPDMSLAGGVESTGEVVGDFFSSMAAMMTAEVVSLVYKYTFCALCCPCCLSPGVGNYREPNKATIMV